MHSIRIHTIIGLIISQLYCIGIWHRGDKPTVKELRIKLFHCVNYSLFVLSLVVGAIINDKKDKSIFMAELSFACVILGVKLWILIWKQSDLLNLLNRVSVFSIRNDDDYFHFNEKLRGFVKFVFVFVISVTVAGFLCAVVLPVFGSEKNVFVEIAFPLDYNNNDVAFWIATIYVFNGVLVSYFITLSTIVIWYSLSICSLRYEVLGSEMKKMGQIYENVDENITETQMHNSFYKDLKASIEAYRHLRQLINDVDSFFSDLFFIQFGTSGLCICGSIYCLVFDIGNNPLERLMYLIVLFYFIVDLFMITYFGNEIMLSSDRLSYSLFESDWYNQPQSTKKCIIIFGEYLKQPQVLVIGKLYTLTLATFTRILNSAYSMFNILKNFR